MRYPKWYRSDSPLQAALQRGLMKGGSLSQELQELDEYPVKSGADALAVCQALEWLKAGRVAQDKSFPSPLHALAELCQKFENPGDESYCVLHEHGSVLLAKLVNQGLSQEGLYRDSDLLFVLNVLAWFGTREAADTVLRAARQSLLPEDELWSHIFEAFEKEQPQAVRVFTELGKTLPTGYLAVALLDAVNRFALGGGELRHPFDSDEGVARLEAWISSTDPEHASYAVSATAALPFLNHEGRHRLLVTVHG